MKEMIFFSGSRADLNLLLPIIKTFKNNKYIKTSLYLGGHHFQKKYGETWTQIKKEKIKNLIKSKVYLKQTDDSNIIKFTSNLTTEFKNYIIKKKPDLIVILGDRYELLSVSISAFFLRIPTVHLHGGEKSIGSFDDTIRHCVSKFSSYHLVSHKNYKKRLIQLGENPSKIFITGAIGSEIAAKSKKNILKNKYNFLSTKFFIVTFHPETNNLKLSERHLNNLLSVIKIKKEYNFIITANNNDTKGDIFLKKIKNFCKLNKNSKLILSLGSEEYFALARKSCGVIGNSSSGIIEIPSLKVPSLNIGSRQLGRIKSPSTLQSNGSQRDILNKINLIMKNKKINYNNLYYKKNTLNIIHNKLIQILNFKKDLTKIFYDIKFKNK